MKIPDWNKIATGKIKHNAHVVRAAKHASLVIWSMLLRGDINAIEYECRMASIRLRIDLEASDDYLRNT